MNPLVTLDISKTQQCEAQPILCIFYGVYCIFFILHSTSLSLLQDMGHPVKRMSMKYTNVSIMC